jgi:hypothetical protein
MSRDSLLTYLNDHLAGSIAAVELVELLVGTSPDSQSELYHRIRQEIEEDQRVLQRIIERLGGKESRVRKAAAWLTQKLGRAKFQVDDPGDGELRTLEALEALCLGIQGKLALWRSLEAVGVLPEMEPLDLAGLQRRALDQFERVDRLRLEAAQTAFA